MSTPTLSCRVPLAVVALAATLSLAACGGDSTPPASQSPADLDRVWQGAGTTIEVRVHELHCEKCEDSARQALGAVPGVERVEADHESDVVRIELAAAADRYALIPALREALHGIGKDIVGEDDVPEDGAADAGQ